jgi:CheY-like chemotaxis protein
MSKKILLIESDAPFAEELSSTLEARGLEVRTTGDGREGYELAKEWGPDAIVLCVELPGMSGYVICQKLKKDESLKSIPLVITSAEATPETFEKHRTLKVRAEDYLLKPFDAEALIASLGAFMEIPEASPAEPLLDDAFPPAPFPEEPLEGVGLEEPAPTVDEEELVALEEEAGIEALGGEPLGGGDLPDLDLGSLPDDAPAPESGPGLEDDLKLLDEAFEGISAAPAAKPSRPAARQASSGLDFDLGGEAPMDPDDLDAAAASLPEGDDRAARAAFGGLDMVADEALDALGSDEPTPHAAEVEPESGTDLGRDLLGGLDPDFGLGSGPTAEPEPPPEPARPPARGASPEAHRAAGADTSRLERELARKDQKIQDLEARLRESEDGIAEVERRAEEAEQRTETAEKRAAESASRLAAAESQAAATKSRLDSTLAQSKRLDTDLKAARSRAEQAESALDDERRRADDAEARAAAASEAQEKIDALEREVDELKTELVVARGEAEGARGEVEKRTGELRKRVQELEQSASKNEERVVKAYLKIKNDEKVREKTKKALAIASQLLDEGAAAGEPASAEKPRTAAQAAAAALGRDQ